jgi:outer membrane biosynthesis protein TonB
VFASLVLALVLGMVYYVSTRRNAPTPASATSISTAAPEAVTEPAPPVEEPTPEQQTAPAVAPDSKPAATQTPAKKSSTKTTPTSQPKPTPETKKKEDNKVNSILKKTGRILKKPFKF